MPIAGAGIRTVVMARKAGNPGLWAKVKKLFATGGSPDRVAGSFAVGALCGTIPCFMGPVFLALGMKFLKINKFIAAGVMALFLANPLVFLLMAGQFWLGLAIMDEPAPVWLFSMDGRRIMEGVWTSPRLFAAYALGGITSSLVLASVVFGVVRWLAAWRLGRRKTRAEGG